MSQERRSVEDLAVELAQALFGAELPQVRAETLPQSDPEPGRSELEQALTSATERASVVGRFLPSELVRGIAQPVAEAVLSTMIRDCDVELHSDQRVWVLGRDLRQNMLARLYAGGDLSHLTELLDTVPPQPWDDAGRYLHAMLRGRRVRTPDSLPNMRALAQACDWVSGVLDVKAREEELRQEIAFRSLVEEKDRLLEGGFFGRKDALATITRFIAGEFTPVDGLPPVLMVSGIGGSGKSTLLAKVTRDLLQQRGQGAPAVFEIDFDRFGLGPHSLIELTFEISRQIELYEPALSDDLMALRMRVRDDLARDLGTDTRGSAALEVVIRFQYDVMPQLGDIIGVAGWRQRDMLLVLDTFEELQAKRIDPEHAGSSGAQAADQIASWIRRLVQIGGLNQLKVLISGRAPIAEGSELHALVVKAITLDDLEPDEAILLLGEEGLNADDAAQLQPLVGGNPLLLRIAARLVRRLPAEQRDAVLRDLPGNTEMDRELVQGVLYDRILQHIRNDKARSLAHPGLVLRRVTWRLIRDVLAGPCDLGTLDEPEAKRLLAALGDEVWLVDRDPKRNGVLLHRSDIRRMMMRLMARDRDGRARRLGGAKAVWPAQRPLAEVAPVIHQRALEFYAARQDPEDDAATAEAEAFYHRMMLVDDSGAADVTSEEIARMAANFGGDVELLAPALRLRVRQLSGAPLTVEDAVLLPRTDWRSFAHREGQSRLDGRQEPLSALALITHRDVAEPGEAPGWQLRALDAAVRWNEPDTEWLERVRVPDEVPADVEEGWPSHSAAKALLFWRRREYAAAMTATHAVVLEMRSAVGTMSTDQADLAQILRCANYALLARAAYDREQAGPAGLLGGLMHANWPFDALPPAADHPGLDLELRRYAALTWRPGTKLPFRLGLTAHAFVPDVNWLQKIAALTGDSALVADLPGLREGASTTDIISRAAGEFAQRMAQRRPEGLFASAPPPDDFDPLLLCGTHPDMRPAAKFALRQGFSTHGELRRLAELALPLLPIAPGDLQPTVFADPNQLPSHAVSLLAEYADRSRVLPQVLAAAAAERPKCEPLQAVSASLTRWHATFAHAVAANRAHRSPPETVELDRWPGLPYVARVAAPSGEQQRMATDALSTRLGYDAKPDGTNVPMPEPPPTVMARDSVLLLRYMHFSVLLSRRSGLLIYAAANIHREGPFGLPQSINAQALSIQLPDPRVDDSTQPLLPVGARFAFAISPVLLAYPPSDDAIRALGDLRYAPSHIPVRGASIGAADHPREKLWNQIEWRVLGIRDCLRGVLFSGLTPACDIRWKVVASVEAGLLVPAAFTVSTNDPESPIHQLRLRDLENSVGLSFGPLTAADRLTGDGHEVSELFHIAA